jgi:hypothetical protein
MIPSGIGALLIPGVAAVLASGFDAVVNHVTLETMICRRGIIVATRKPRQVSYPLQCSNSITRTQSVSIRAFPHNTATRCIRQPPQERANCISGEAHLSS